MEQYFLYVILFPNGKQYFGISKNVENRKASHIALARRKANLPVHQAINKYGAENVKIRTLVEGSKRYIASLEIKAIAFFKTQNRAFGYNVSDGGEISPMLTKETRDKVSASMKERYKNPENLKRNSEAQKIAQNRPDVMAKRALRPKLAMAPEHKKKIGDAHRGRIQSAEWVANRAVTQVGAKRSEASRQRMSEGQKKRVRTAAEIERMTEMAQARVMTDSHRENLRKAALARWARVREASK